jgi:hypothetical protein
MGSIYCSNCKKESSSHLMVCPFCNEVKNKMAAELPKGTKLTGTMGPLGWFVFLSLIVLMMWFSNSCHTDATNNTASKDYAPSVGEEGRISCADVVFVSEDLGTRDELLQAAVAKDTIGENQLVASGRVLFAHNATKVLVLDNGIGRLRVRFLEGKNYGKAGWVDSEAVKRL